MWNPLPFLAPCLMFRLNLEKLVSFRHVPLEEGLVSTQKSAPTLIWGHKACAFALSCCDHCLDFFVPAPRGPLGRHWWHQQWQREKPQVGFKCLLFTNLGATSSGLVVGPRGGGLQIEAFLFTWKQGCTGISATLWVMGGGGRPPSPGFPVFLGVLLFRSKFSFRAFGQRYFFS